jgi:4-amino-4-deoxy-L-arabinose transferase-like glycosyltransferase
LLKDCFVVKRRTFLLLTAILGLGAFLRLPSLTFPIWLGDESYYVGLAQNLLAGRINYVNDYHHIPPGITYAYSLLLSLFGANNMLAVHLATLLMFSGTTFFIYRLGTHLADERAGLLAAWFFSIQNVCFNPAWSFSSLPELFITFFYTFGLYLLFKQKKKSVFFSGIVLAVSVLFKQSELLVILAALIYLIVFSPHLIVNFLAGVGIVSSVTILVLVGQGSWGDFYYQNFDLLLQRLIAKRNLSPSHSLLATADRVFWNWAKSSFVLWVGLILAIIYYPTRKLFCVFSPRSERGLTDGAGLELPPDKLWGLILMFSVALVYVAILFWFRWIHPYYLILLLPPMTILAGVGFSLIWNHLRGYSHQVAIGLLALSLFVSYRRDNLPLMKYFISYTVTHHRLPYVNRIPIGNYNPTLVDEVIKKTGKTERVLIWGWYCWVNVLADRRFGIGLLETQTMAKAKKDFRRYLYHKLDRQLKEDGPDVIIDFPGADNSQRINTYPKLSVWIQKHYETQPFLDGTLYRKIKG